MMMMMMMMMLFCASGFATGYGKWFVASWFNKHRNILEENKQQLSVCLKAVYSMDLYHSPQGTRRSNWRPNGAGSGPEGSPQKPWLSLPFEASNGDLTTWHKVMWTSKDFCNKCAWWWFIYGVLRWNMVLLWDVKGQTCREHRWLMGILPWEKMGKWMQMAW